jgi:kynurenine formamidase
MPTIPSAADVIGYLDSLSNWGRWGADDRLGTLNFITSEVRGRAFALARDGIVVSCALEISDIPQPGNLFGTPHRHMLRTGEGLGDAERVPPPPFSERAPGSAQAGADWQQHAARPRYAGASEFIGMVFHGLNITHVDALSHSFWDRAMYNGLPASRVTVHSGATQLAVTDVPAGIVGRGVLLDAAAVRGVSWLEPGDGVMPNDLEAAEERQGVTVGEGDIVLLRTGYGRRRRELGPLPVDDGQSGWHAACLPWLHERRVAAIGADTAQDVVPTGYEGSELGLPVHSVALVAMGMWLIDNCDLEDLRDTCERLGRWEFLLTLSTLRLAGATGSPVNPLAMF